MVTGLCDISTASTRVSLERTMTRVVVLAVDLSPDDLFNGLQKVTTLCAASFQGT